MEIDEIQKALFWSKVEITKYCWIWKASKNNKGYGCFEFNNKQRLSHRLSFEIINGKIPKNKIICHKCDNPLCVNPDHLFHGSYQENMTDMQLKCRKRALGKLSKFNGVYFRKDSKKWRAYISYKKKQFQLGTFETEIEAARAYDKKCYKLFNKKEMLNFPNEI